MTDPIAHSSMEQLSALIAAQLGLHYPRERWNDLEEALRSAAPELGLSDEMKLVERLLGQRLTQSQTEILPKHLTVGETYFFREKPSLDVLEEQILPQLVRSRMEGDRRLRIWSAGCCTGEEPYSIAILLSRLIPGLASWNITMLGTDINPRFLRKASEGLYNKWSFRETPTWITERYFKSTRDGCFELLPPQRKMVTFSYLNLVDDTYPALVTNTNAMDLILCRNVLMYFTRPQAQKVIQKMHHCLIDGGWLLVGASETSQSFSPHFTTVNFPGATLYKKELNKPLVERTPWIVQDETTTISIGQFHEVAVSAEPQVDRAYFPAETFLVPAESQKLRVGEPQEKEYRESTVAFEEGRYAEAAEKLLILLSRLPGDPKSLALLAHVYANLEDLLRQRSCVKGRSRMTSSFPDIIISLDLF